MAQLLGFRKVTLRAGAATTVRITQDAGPTLQRDPASRRWSPRTGDWALPAARHSPVCWAGADRLQRREGAIDEGGVPAGRPA